MAARRRGEDIIDFGMGNPDGPTPQHIVDKLIETVQRARHARLLGVAGHPAAAPRDLPLVRSAAGASNSIRRPRRSSTIGSKEGIAHLALATLGRGDTVLVPNPSYPIHIYGPVIAGADIRHVPMTPDVDFFAELEQTIQHELPEAEDADHQLPVESDGAVRRAAVLREDRRARARARHLRRARSRATPTSAFDGWKAPSIMQVEGARDVAVEFFTMSKSYNMAGWRIGFMVGNKRPRQRARADQGLPRLRHVHADPGGGDRRARGSAGLRRRNRDEVPEAARRAGEGAARSGLDGRRSRRRRCTCGRRFPSAYRAAGSLEFTKQLLAQAKVSVSPGIGFGEFGDESRALRDDRERERGRGRRSAASSRCSARMDCADERTRCRIAMTARTMKPLQVGLLGIGTVGTRHVDGAAPERGGDRAPRGPADPHHVDRRARARARARGDARRHRRQPDRRCRRRCSRIRTSTSSSS